jgi:hypothetical protein
VVLRWIADGCADDVAEGSGYKRIVHALKTDDLVKISRHSGTWAATLTAAGQYYLQHGVHPEAHKPSSPRASAPSAKTAQNDERATSAYRRIRCDASR